MTDMLVKLYNLPTDWAFLAEQEAKGVTVRKPIAPEKRYIVDWVEQTFSEAWAIEIDITLTNQPISCFIAIKAGELVGFGCYDSIGLGMFGPTGVAEAERGQGIGRALLLACLLDMRLKGYAYAIIGYIGPAAFYEKTVGAVEIPDSTPSIWKGMLKKTTP